MTLLDRIRSWWERRSVRLSPSIYSGGRSDAGITVTDSTALALSTVWACVRAIADPIGFLPLHVYRRRPDGGRQRAPRHEAYYLLHDSPWKNITAVQFRSTLQAHVLLRGNGFARIWRRSGSGQLYGLEILDPDRMRLVIDDDGEMHYEYASRRGVLRLGIDEVLHLRGLSHDGLWGYSVITQARQALGLAAALESYGARFFASGGRLPYLLRHPGNFRSEQEFEQFRARWKEAYGSTDTWHTPAVLTGGLEYVPIGIKMEDAQFLNSRQFQVQEICRWFRVSPHLVADLSRATFSNIEHLGIEFLTQTLSYWLEVWEQEINLKLLGPGHYAEFDVNALVRGAFESRMRGYATQLQNGIISINEARALENLNPIPGGDVHHIQLNMQPVANTGGSNGSGTEAQD